VLNTKRLVVIARSLTAQYISVLQSLCQVLLYVHWNVSLDHTAGASVESSQKCSSETPIGVDLAGILRGTNDER